MNIETYRSLFIHRSDVYAAQHSDGSYRPVRSPITDDEIQEHLAGFASYGVYVIDPLRQVSDAEAMRRLLPKEECGKNTVKYLVFDLDTYSPEAYEWLAECLQYFISTLTEPAGMVPATCLLMENSGGKGFHAWLFLSDPTPAYKVRGWVAESFLPRWSERSSLFDGTPLEIFPKQDEVAEGAFGNLVKLPLGVHAKSGKRSEFVPCQGWASDVHSVQRLKSSLIPDPPNFQQRTGSTGSGNARQGSNPAPFACISQIIEDGAPQGCRDDAMFHFAHYANGTGLPEDLVEEWCERVNEGFSPPLRSSEVRTKVRSAVSMKAPHPGCNADWLRGFCPGGERCFAPWNEDKPARAGTLEVADSYLDMTPEQRREARLRRE